MRVIPSLLCAAALLVTSSFAAQAIVYTPQSAVGPSGDHSYWAPNLNHGGGNDYDFTAGAFTWNGGTTATLTGALQSQANASRKFDLTLNLTLRGTGATGVSPTTGPKCELPGGCGTSAANVPPGSTYGGAGVNPWTDWTYFDVVPTGSKLVGADFFDGLVLDLTQRPAVGEYPFQLGDCANNKNCNFGASVWLFYELSGDSTGPWQNTNSHGSNYLPRGIADINIDLNPVPVPAAVWLFASALLGLFGVARVRAAA